jgi:molecular chaperone GrpE
LAGFRLVRQQLETILKNHQCLPIDPLNQPFDPNFHQAILQQPSAEVPAGNVSMVTQTGYQLHDRVVRPAQVIVSSGPP